MARSIGVGAGHQVDVAGVVGGGGVHLLAVDDEFVAVADGAALEAGQVGAGLGLGEAQGEGNLAADDAGEEFLLLLLAARRQDGRAARARASHGDADAGELLLDDVLVDAAAVLGRRTVWARKFRSNRVRRFFRTSRGFWARGAGCRCFPARR